MGKEALMPEAEGLKRISDLKLGHKGVEVMLLLSSCENRTHGPHPVER